ncbi:hypothetical protein P152DRAFT_505592 [Eremomyces bilateralis CBS 781.70]|uniref:J domain-containing protein n=1 Tax=Eremomyces bilateralis CBS 781.70 TaxID=1392243 RepID=A0A6G1GCQ5_9PEZI|nr:uncharacterized protein P152DRAFT_505592 [Eremomyces bilateralis CBS 781.70]KAF1815813.1 hypothetical protein P152DRAFT_505592 [Eremomyces bilateralis CBS 781.70]
MRAVLTLLLIAVLATVTLAWTKEDHEIFRLHDEVAAAEHGQNWYEWLGVPPSASREALDRGYKKKSRQLHPDKAKQAFIASYAKPKKDKDPKAKPTVHVRKQPTAREIATFEKEASARFARLSVVMTVLRGPDRARYDYFLKNGFPAWRGTGYYYERVRPGTGTVLLGLFLFGGGAIHYGAMYLSYKRQRDFVERYTRHARQMAWGDPLGVPGIPTGLGTGAGGESSAAQASGGGDSEGSGSALNRRQKRMQDKEAKRSGKNGKGGKSIKEDISAPVEAEKIISGPVGNKKRVTAPNGKSLLVDSVGNVFIEEETEEGEVMEFLIDVDEIEKPTIFKTIVFRLPIWAYNASIGRLINPAGYQDQDEPLIKSDEADENELLSKATAPNQNAEATKRKSKVRHR